MDEDIGDHVAVQLDGEQLIIRIGNQEIVLGGHQGRDLTAALIAALRYWHPETMLIDVRPTGVLVEMDGQMRERPMAPRELFQFGRRFIDAGLAGEEQAAAAAVKDDADADANKHRGGARLAA